MNETNNDPYLPKLYELLTSQKTLQCRLSATLSRPTLADLDRSITQWFGLPSSLEEANRTKQASADTLIARSVFIHLAVCEFYYTQRLVANYLKMSDAGVYKRLRVVKRWLEDSEFANNMWKFKQQVKKRI